MAVTIVTLVCCAQKTGYEFLFLLPVALCFVVLLPNFRDMAHNYIGIKMLYISMWIRYCVFPLSVSFSDRITGIGSNPSATNIGIATLVMVAECIAVSSVVELYGTKKLLKRGYEQSFKINYLTQNRTHFVEWLVVAISAIFIAIHPDLLNNFSFAVYSTSSSNISYFMGLDIRVIQIAIILIFCLSVGWCKKKHIVRANMLYYYISLLAGVLCMLVFKGENRASLMINIISVIVVLTAVFPDRRRFTVATILGAGIIALVALSLYRILAVTAWRPQGGKLDISFNWLTGMIQGYLGGPRGIAQGIEAASKYPASMGTFLSDLLIWTGYLGNYISEAFHISFEDTSYLFNLSIYGNGLIGTGDQIVPLAAQSIWYLGYLGSPVLSSCVGVMVVLFDKKICKAETIDLIFINTMMAVVTGLMFCYNVSVITMYLMDRYFLAWAVIAFSSYVSRHLRFKMNKKQ
ncbi:MAG: hypothetical protein PHY12_00255 [Eubacteriales bacterium]|nr:hypothetical protein [Eubacteriales bacterium]